MSSFVRAPRFRRRAHAGAAAVLAGVLAGCGTTVPLAQQASPGTYSGSVSDGVAGATTPVAGTSDGSASSATGSGPGQVTTAGGSTTTGVTTPLSGDGTTSVAVPGSASAVSQAGRPVEVGIAYAKNADKFGESLGGALDLGDGKAQNDALVSFINKNGGLAGHPIKPVYYAVDLARTEPWSVFVQEACSLWTEDHHVVAASFPVNIDIGQLSNCLKKHGAILDASSLRLRSQRDYNASPLLVEPWMITVERLAPLYVHGLLAQGYFTGKPVIGLLSYDYPQSQLFAKLITAELHKIGQAVKVTFTAGYADSTSGLGSTIAQVQSSVLKFRSEGVDHLMSSAIPGGIGTAFQPAAQSQGYHPRYGLTSFDAIPDMPDDQATNALAVGWWLNDVDAAHEISNPATKLCRSVFKTNNSASTRSKELLALVYCDFMLLLQHAAKSVDPAVRLDGTTIVQQLDRAGPSFRSSRSLGTSLTSSRRDGAAGLRGLRFDLPCSCWVYAPGR